MNDKPPGRIQHMVNNYNPVVCYPIAPINVYRILFWFKAKQKRVRRIVRADNTDHVRYLDLLAHDGNS